MAIHTATILSIRTRRVGRRASIRARGGAIAARIIRLRRRGGITRVIADRWVPRGRRRRIGGRIRGRGRRARIVVCRVRIWDTHHRRELVSDGLDTEIVAGRRVSMTTDRGRWRDNGRILRPPSRSNLTISTMRLQRLRFQLGRDDSVRSRRMECTPPTPARRPRNNLESRRKHYTRSVPRRRMDRAVR